MVKGPLQIYQAIEDPNAALAGGVAISRHNAGRCDEATVISGHNAKHCDQE